MAKIGLNYGEKLQIADKTYRVITDGLNVPEVLGKLSFRGIEGPDIIFEEDRTQRNPDGSFVQVNTGEIRGIVVAIHSSIQHETLFFTIADMAQSEIEDLGIGSRRVEDKAYPALREGTAERRYSARYPDSPHREASRRGNHEEGSKFL